MKITKSQLKQIIKEELKEAKKRHPKDTGALTDEQEKQIFDRFLNFVNEKLHHHQYDSIRDQLQLFADFYGHLESYRHQELPFKELLQWMHDNGFTEEYEIISGKQADYMEPPPPEGNY
jgi:hypothetical protein